jgi:hypothetical protein
MIRYFANISIYRKDCIEILDIAYKVENYLRTNKLDKIDEFKFKEITGGNIDIRIENKGEIYFIINEHKDMVFSSALKYIYSYDDYN